MKNDKNSSNIGVKSAKRTVFSGDSFEKPYMMPLGAKRTPLCFAISDLSGHCRKWRQIMKVRVEIARLVSGVAFFAAVGANPASADKMQYHMQPKRAEEAARSAETVRNRAIITAFADLFYRQGDIERAMMTYVVPDYIQHSPGVPNGRAAMLDMAKRFAGRPKPNFEIKRIVVDGDIAVLHIRGQLRADLPAEAVFDMFRLKNGKIVEHWDVRQPVPETASGTMF